MTARAGCARRTFGVLTTVAAIAMLLRPLPAQAAPVPRTTGQAVPVETSFEHLTPLGVTNLGQLAQGSVAQASAAARAGTKPTAAGHAEDRPPGADARNRAVPVPDPAPSPITSDVGAATGFSGLDANDSVTGDKGNEIFEPPDQGLCAGHGLIVEMVNRAEVTVYTDAGQQLVAPVAMNAFFGLAPSINFETDPPTFGPVMTDPQCYFDTQAGRWLLTIAVVDTDPATGNFTNNSGVAIAVSQSSDPTSTWARYRLDTDDVGVEGAPSHPGCPCFADQPQIGADSNGFYISTNEFTLSTFDFNGAQIYAISKWQLAAAAVGAPLPTVVHLEPSSVGGTLPAAVHPATTPPGGTYQPNAEFFLSNPGIGSPDSRLIAWALVHTDRLTDVHPALTLTASVVQTEPFTEPPNVVQRPGPAPLGDSVGEPLNVLESDDYRVQQVQFTRGRLFTTLDTGLTGGRAGVAWFVIAPILVGDTITAFVDRQGYVGVAGDSLLYGAVGVTAAGRGVIAMGLAGPDYYPSAAHVAIDLHGVQGPVRVTGAGTAPEDGVSCYQAFYGPSAAEQGCLWGDYSAAVAEDASTIITGSEYIPPRPRSTYINWGTFVSRIHV